MRQDTPLRRILSSRAAKLKLPVSGGFELTPRCNLSCKMCYIHQNGNACAAQELSVERWLDMGRQAADAGALFLLLTGGEPFLRPDLPEIYLGLTKMGLSVSINSNGTLIDDRAIEWLRQSPPAQINISLYGVSRETYARLCGVPEAFDRVQTAIDALLRAGIQVGINATMSPINGADMDGIVAFAKERGLRVRPVYYLFPPVRREAVGCTAPIRYDAEEAGRRTALAQSMTEETERMQRYAWAQPDADSFEPADDCVRAEGAPLGCLAGSSQFWISWDGKLMPCGMLDEPAMRPFETGFAPAWRDLVAETAKFRLPAVCGECTLRSACPACAAINRAETGRVDERPDYLCRLTKEYVRTLQALFPRKTGDA